jgi:hypothetical protein
MQVRRDTSMRCIRGPGQSHSPGREERGRQREDRQRILGPDRQDVPALAPAARRAERISQTVPNLSAETPESG